MAPPSSFVDIDLATLVEEAYERAGINVQQLSSQHLTSAYNALIFILSMWSNKIGIPFVIEDFNQTTTTNQTYVSVPTTALDVLAATVVQKNSNFEITLRPYTRWEYVSITDKNTLGQPSIYFYDQTTRRLYLYPGINTVDDLYSIKITYFKRLYDFTTTSETLQTIYQYWDALAYELAYRLAFKRPDISRDPNRLALLKAEAKSTLEMAMQSTAEAGTFSYTFY